MLTLRKLNMRDSKKEYQFFQENPEENGFMNPYFGFSYEKFINEAIPERLMSSKGIGLPEGHVPDTYYFLWEEDHIIGLFKVRHYLNEFLVNGSGHIGYGIHHLYRGKGYATKGLAMAIQKLKSMPDFEGDEVYMSCNKTNPASLKVMKKNGAYIHHEDEKEYYTRIKINKD